MEIISLDFNFCLSLKFLHLSYRGVNEIVEHKEEIVH